MSWGTRLRTSFTTHLRARLPEASSDLGGTTRVALGYRVQGVEEGVGFGIWIGFRVILPNNGGSHEKEHGTRNGHRDVCGACRG